MVGVHLNLKENEFDIQVIKYFEYETSLGKENIALIKRLNTNTPTRWIVCIDLDLEQGCWWRGEYFTDEQLARDFFRQKVSQHL